MFGTIEYPIYNKYLKEWIERERILKRSNFSKNQTIISYIFLHNITIFEHDV